MGRRFQTPPAPNSAFAWKPPAPRRPASMSPEVWELAVAALERLEERLRALGIHYDPALQDWRAGGSRAAVDPLGLVLQAAELSEAQAAGADEGLFCSTVYGELRWRLLPPDFGNKDLMQSDKERRRHRRVVAA
jgi:hypothetical protein